MLKNIPVAIQLYSLRNEMAADVDATLKKVAELGYDGVEFGGDLFGYSAAEMKAMCAKYNLNPISAHVPLDDMNADPEGIMKTYSEIGCKYVAMPWLAEERRPGNPDYDKTLVEIKALCDVAEKYGITVLYHNHDFEFVKIGEEYALDIMYDNIPKLETELDLCWVAVAGESPTKYVNKYTGRTPVVHFKDFYMPGKKPGKMYELIGTEVEDVEDDAIFEFRPVGYGQQSWPDILDATIASGSNWIVVEQDEPSIGKTPTECAELSINYLNTLN